MCSRKKNLTTHHINHAQIMYHSSEFWAKRETIKSQLTYIIKHNKTKVRRTLFYILRESALKISEWRNTL